MAHRKVKLTPRIVGSVRLSGIHGIHDVSVPGAYAPPERRQLRDQSKAGIKIQEPDGGFADEQEKLRLYGLIP